MIVPAVGTYSRVEQARDRALAAAALADERRDRARAKREADVVDGTQELRRRPATTARTSGKCFDNPCASRTASRVITAGSGMRGLELGRAEVAGDGVAERDGRELRPDPDLEGVESGFAAAQCGQRGWNRQPAGRTARGRAARLGCPSIRTRSPDERWERARSARRCRDAARRRSSRSAGASSTISPAYMIAIRCRARPGARGRA